ncbi:MAG: guanylate kinase [Coriobacteriaceae bacterium]|nr:guanylate kinase [Coriobacteriaceae bacterium]
MRGNLFIISGPSGAGKGTLVVRILKELNNVWLSVSATTRDPRPDEVDGIHYFFVSDQRFDQLIEQNGLLEWASVHGCRYGTLRDEVIRRLESGIDVILEIDPQGAFQVKEKLSDAILIFVMPPSMAELERRLRIRGTESCEQIAARLRAAKVEIFTKERYNSVVINDDLEKATNDLVEIIMTARQAAIEQETDRV